MQPSADLIARFLAAREGGTAVPEEVLSELENCFRGKAECKQRAREHLRKHFLEYERPQNKKPGRAAGDMADNLDLLAKHYDDPNIAPQYRQLFDKINGLGERMPGDETIRKILGKN